MGGKAKSIIKQTVGVVAAPFTGGASLALTASEMYKNKKKKMAEATANAEKEAEKEAEKARVLGITLEEQKRKQQLSDYYGNNQIGTNPVSGSPFKTLLGQ